MEEKNKAPLLLEFLFGESAETAQRGASERLMRWAEAFDEWLEIRRTRFSPNVGEDSHRAWAEFLAFTRKAPWEIREAKYGCCYSQKKPLTLAAIAGLPGI